MEDKHKYFNKAKLYYKITFFGFIWIILFSQIFKEIYPIIAAFLIVIPFLGEFVVVPLGLFCVVKSYTTKEPFHRYRLLYLMGYLFFAIILLGFIIAITSDIKYFMHVK